MVDPDGMASVEVNGVDDEKPKPKPKPEPKPIQLEEVVIKSGPGKGLIADSHYLLGMSWTSYRLPQAAIQANQADALAFLGARTPLGRVITAVNSLLEITSKPLTFKSQLVKSAEYLQEK